MSAFDPTPDGPTPRTRSVGIVIFALSLLALLAFAPGTRAAAASDIFAGADAGAPIGTVKVFDGQTGSSHLSLFLPAFTGGVRVAAGDVNGDGFIDIIAGTGPGVPGGLVNVYKGTHVAEPLSELSAFEGFTGGVFVAAGDVNGDGLADIIVGADAGAPGGHVKVFSGADLSLTASWFAFSTGFSGGVRVAVGDVNGDGFADIIAGAGPGAPGGHIKVFSGADLTELASFFAFDGFAGGVHVASGDIDGDGFADIIAGAGAGGSGGHVKIFGGRDLSLLASWLAFPGFLGGVRVATGDVNVDGQADIVVGAGRGSPGGHIKVFNGADLTTLQSFFSFDSFVDGVYVASTPAALGSPDSDGDGIPDDADPDTAAAVVLEQDAASFSARGHRTALLSRLDEAERLIMEGDIAGAIRELENLLRRLDGCGEHADRDDWIVDCPAQLEVRHAIESIIAALGG